MERNPLIAIGCLNGALAVGAGAFAAHGLKERLDEAALKVFETGARYHMYHALAMVLAGVLVAKLPGANMAGWIFQLGILLFAGSLYVLALTGTKGFGAVTPFGGVAFIVGWLWLGWSAWKGASA